MLCSMLCGLKEVPVRAYGRTCAHMQLVMHPDAHTTLEHNDNMNTRMSEEPSCSRSRLYQGFSRDQSRLEASNDKDISFESFRCLQKRP